MNLSDIEESIIELEGSATTFDNALKLASLYILRDNLKPALNEVVDGVRDELNDILPQYHHYIEVRKDFQLGKTTKTEMLQVLGYLCQEIREFLQALFISTSGPDEQQIIHDLYDSLRR